MNLSRLLKIIGIYWLFYFEVYLVFVNVFFEEFFVYLENIVMCFEVLFIFGDFNFYFDSYIDFDVDKFLDLLEIFGFI